MDGLQRWSNGSTRWVAVVLGLAAAAASAGLVPAREASPVAMGSPTGDAPITGEHSAAGQRRIDELNQAIGSMQRLRGEHAGVSRADNEAVGR